jgi:glycerophosphoryl diester phosphodiesterase
VQPFPGRPTEYDGLYEIPTFEEVLALVARRAAEAGRPVGIYPETKHPGYFASIGMDFEEPLLAALKDFAAGPVFIQSFEPEILKRLKGKTDAKLVQLVYEKSPGAGSNIPLAEIAEYADGVGPAKGLVFFDNKSTSFVEEAHGLNLAVHPWTFRADQRNEEMKGPFVIQSAIRTTPNGSLSFAQKDKSGAAFTSKPKKDVMWEPVTMGDGLIYTEYELFFELGIDGVFTDFPDIAVKARAERLQQSQ